MNARRRSVIKSIEPTRIILPLNKLSTYSSKNIPTIPTGIADINILEIKIVSEFFSNFNILWISFLISYLKTYKILMAVAKWTMTVNNKLSALSVLRKYDPNSRWPLLLMGRNSVSPWTNNSV